MKAALEAFFQAPRGGRSGHRLYLHHLAAQGSAQGSVLFVHPHGEAMNKSRRMAALQSRALAAAGFNVLQIDLLGCGDSSGDLADASWDDWVQDVLDAADWLARRHADALASLPFWLWGHREGALLATAAATRIQVPVQLLLWQPVLMGRQAVQQFLRLKAAAQLVDGGGKGVVEGLRADLAAGRPVEVAGYTLGPALAQGLDAATLVPPALAQGPTGSAPRAVWFEVNSQPGLQPSPAAQAAQGRWLAAGWALEQQAVAGPSFWQTVEIEDAPALVQATLAAVSRPPSSTATTGGATATPPESGNDSPAAERAVVFDCQGEGLLGILHPASGDTAVVVVVGGPQYRAGSHRLFVTLARSLAACGHPVLRFDVRGMGDSTGEPRSFEDLGDDIGAAIALLQQQQPQVRRVVLWGLCDGASAALLYLHEHPDPRVAGLCLLNPWVRSPASLARTHVKHYYRQRLMQREFWMKLASGRVAGQALRGLWANLRAARTTVQAPDAARPFQARMAAAWAAFNGPTLLVLSGDDYTAREFVEYAAADADWRGLTQRPQVSLHEAAGADHTFSDSQHSRSLVTVTQQWLARALT